MNTFRVHIVDNAADYLFETEAEAREFCYNMPLGVEFKLCRI